jgi:hypothetical protein
MGRRLRVEIAKGNEVLVFIDDVRRYFAGGDLAEDGIGHWTVDSWSNW